MFVIEGGFEFSDCRLAYLVSLLVVYWLEVAVQCDQLTIIGQMTLSCSIISYLL